MSLGRMPARVAPLPGPKPWWKSRVLVLVPALILLVVLFPADSASAQTRPKVTDIDFIGLPNSGDTYRRIERIRVLVTFDKDVTVDRSLLHFVGLEIGSRKGLAWYAGGIGGLAVFEYLVVDGDMDENGVSIRANAMVGTIVDATDGTTVAVLTHDAVPDDPLRKVDGTPPEPGVTVWPRTRTVPEGGTASYQVALDSAPRGSVTVSVTPAADSDPDLGATPTRLTFTASNWSTGQTVTVSAADDQDGTVGTATFRHTATSTDPEYSGIEIVDVTAAENDDEYAHFIPFFPSASTGVQGFARIINRSDEAGDVYIFGIDDDGERHGPARLALSELESAHFNSQNLEDGAPDKGLTHGLGDGAGMWRLEFATQLRILPLAYIRTPDGFVTAMQGVAESSTGEAGTAHYVPFFNPGSNNQQVSQLRIVNPGPEDVAVTIEGIDDHGNEGGDVRFTLSGGETRTVTAQELESGESGLSGRLGDGAGKWRLDVTADAPVEVVNLLESPTGHLANLSAAGLRGVVGDGTAHLLPLFPAAGQGLEGFARFINHSDTAGTATIYGIDDGGETHGPITLALRKRGAAHFNSGDLESGNAGKGLSGGLGDGEGNWRLLVSSDLDVEALAYIRTSDGFVTTMHEVVRETAIGQHVPFFNPASNRRQVSHLRLVNPTDNPVNVTISGRDDAGESPSGSAVHLSLAPGEARSIAVDELESGASGLSGRLGDGVGKWQLFVSSDDSIEVTSLLESPTGHLANLSTSVGTITVADPVVTPTGVESIEIDGETVEAAIDQVLVFLEEDVTRKELFDLRARAQELSIDSAFDPDLRMLQLVVDSDADEAEIIEELRARAGVSTAGPNSLVYLDAPPVLDNETGYRRYLERSGGRLFADLDVNPLAVPLPTTVGFSGDYWIDTIHAASAWLALSGETLHDNSIGVVDTGLPSTQDVLSEARVSRFDEKGNPLSDDDTPDETHGLWVSGFAAGYGNGLTRRGVNPHSSLVFVDVERARTSFLGGLGCKIGVLNCTFVTNVVQGIKTAINQGAQVVNVSWADGSECSDRQSSRLSSHRSFRLDKVGAMHFAREKDALVVWSSGNNCEKRDDQLLPSAGNVATADSWRSHALVVAASDAANRDACWSRMGGVVNLAAPGDGIGWGSGIGSGTSYSAPLVTGAAGLVRALNDTLSAPETRAILIRSANVPLTPRTTAQNRAVVDDDCMSFPATESTWSAVTPRGILNLDTTVQTALLTQGIGLETKPDTILSLGSTATVTVDVRLPPAGVNALDIVFLIDQSGSYSDDIDTLQSQASRIIDDLNGRDIDVRFGVAGFADFPIGFYGSTGDTAYRLYQSLTSDAGSVKSAIERLDHPLMSGADGPESQLEALFQVASGLGRDANGDGDFADPEDVRPGSVGWREGALPVVMLATDAPFHDRAREPSYPGPTREETLAALNERGLIVFGLQSGGHSGTRRDIEQITTGTGGLPFELDSASSTIADKIATALTGALSSLDVSLEPIAGGEWVTRVDPETQTGEPGETVTFTVILTGQRRSSIDDLAYHVYLWARADGRAVLKRVAIPICVGRCR